jgi:hypothetical protein
MWVISNELIGDANAVGVKGTHLKKSSVGNVLDMYYVVPTQTSRM